MTDAPEQLLVVAARVDHALAEVFAAERATWRELDPALDVLAVSLKEALA